MMTVIQQLKVEAFVQTGDPEKMDLGLKVLMQLI